MQAHGQGETRSLAWRMAFIAAFAQNVGIGLMFGSFGVLLATIEAELKVDRSWSALGMPLVMINIACLSLFVGSLATRFRIRTLMIVGALLTMLGYLALAYATTIVENLLAYALLIGPGLVFLSIVLPSALTARWFTDGRGRALGLVNMPIFVMLVPIGVTVLLRSTDLRTTYLVLSFVAALVLPALCFIREYPDAPADVDAGEAGATVSPAELLHSGRYWSMCLAAAAIVASSTVLSTHIVPMAGSWGIHSSSAAILISIMAGTGVIGSFAFGWIADRLGGNKALALNCLFQMALWFLLFWKPTFIVLAILIGLMGICTGAILATFGVALADHFGAESFGRAYGLSNLINLPVIAGAAPFAAWMFVRTGSYDGTIAVQLTLLGFGGILAFLSRPPRQRLPSGT